VEFLLFGLAPPSNIARAVRQAQESLYAGWGLVSPLALPPLIPLRFAAPERPPSAQTRSGLERELVAALRGPAAPRAPRCRTGGCALREEVLFWELEGELTAFSSLAERLSPWPAPEPPPFPPRRGFLLALPEPEADLHRAAAGLSLPPAASFTTTALVLLAVRRLTPEPLDPAEEPPAALPWYRALEWEELLRLALRKPPPSRPQDSG
jgi:hypothetical protein